MVCIKYLVKITVKQKKKPCSKSLIASFTLVKPNKVMFDYCKARKKEKSDMNMNNVFFAHENQFFLKFTLHSN